MALALALTLTFQCYHKDGDEFFNHTITGDET
jgi:hypothetical protein